MLMKYNLSKLVFALFTAFVLGVFSSCTQVDPAGINLSSISDSGYESSGTQTISVNLDKSISSDVTIEFEYSGTATKSSDYNFYTTEATILAGQTSAEIEFTIFDDYEYDPTDKTIIINLTTISGPGVDEVNFGENTTYTYTLQEDDMEIELTWDDSDYNMELLLVQGETPVRESIESGTTAKSVVLHGDDSDGNYQTLTYMSLGNLNENSSIPYSVTLNFPDGSSETHGDNLIVERLFNARHLWEITKTGTGYTAAKDPLGSNGRGSIGN
mgnify:CR=1 FL=1